MERLLAAVVEQHHDDAGIVWPVSVAPFSVTVATVGHESELVEVAERVVMDLDRAGVDVLYDDRDERAGVKLNDADLIGIPLRIAIGKRGLATGTVELKRRASSTIEHVAISEVGAAARQALSS